MSESTNEENETQAIAEEADDRCAECNACRRKLRAEAKRERSVHEARDEALPHCDLRWIAPGNLSSEIVVNSPAETRSSNQHRST